MTWIQARDEIFTMLNTAWVLNSGAIVSGDPPPIQWQGQEMSAPPAQDVAFIRVNLVHTQGYQETFGGTGGRLFARRGFISVQCFAPITNDNGLTISEALAKLVLDTYEGKSSPGGVWFRNCHMSEVGPRDGFYQTNAVIDVVYDELK